jgi:hypothetical protein
MGSGAVGEVSDDRIPAATSSRALIAMGSRRALRRKLLAGLVARVQRVNSARGQVQSTTDGPERGDLTGAQVILH